MIFLLIGILLMIVQDRGLWHEIGVAFLIAALLGFSIDFYLHRSIAKDAFEGAMGYFLPDDIKEAVRYIGAIDWFAEDFSITVNLAKIDDELIKCTIKTRKFVRNISGSTRSNKSNIHVDDWGHREKSYIVSCEAKTASTTKVLNQESVKYADSTVYGETDFGRRIFGGDY